MLPESIPNAPSIDNALDAAPAEIKRILDNFWREQEERLSELIFPSLKASTLQGAKTGAVLLREMKSYKQDVDLDWVVINRTAIEYAKFFSDNVAAQVTNTSMAAFLNEFPGWIESGKGISDLVDRLKPYYGDNRAEMIAVTETTRAFAGGNIITWMNSDRNVAGYRWEIAFDDRVCPLCWDMYNNNPYPLSFNTMPPRHVRCRCYMRPLRSLD
jgi:hypothetical protein